MGFTAGKLSGLAGKSSTQGACWFILPFLTTHSLVQRALVKYPLAHKGPGPGPVTAMCTIHILCVMHQPLVSLSQLKRFCSSKLLIKQPLTSPNCLASPPWSGCKFLASEK